MFGNMRESENLAFVTLKVPTYGTFNREFSLAKGIFFMEAGVAKSIILKMLVTHQCVKFGQESLLSLCVWSYANADRHISEAWSRVKGLAIFGWYGILKDKLELKCDWIFFLDKMDSEKQGYPPQGKIWCYFFDIIYLLSISTIAQLARYAQISEMYRGVMSFLWLQPRPVDPHEKDNACKRLA